MAARSARFRRSSPSPDRDDLADDLLAGTAEDAFSSWVRWCTDVRDATDGRAPAPADGIEHFLAGLISSTEPLDTEVALALAVPVGTTIGDAASVLSWTVDDPAGPRCRSYRAGVYFLRHRVDAAIPHTFLAAPPRAGLETDPVATSG